MTQSVKITFGKKENATGFVGRAPRRPDCGTGQSVEGCGKFVLEVSARVLGGKSVLL